MFSMGSALPKISSYTGPKAKSAIPIEIICDDGVGEIGVATNGGPSQWRQHLPISDYYMGGRVNM